MARNLPNGNRVYVKPRIGGKVRACRVKSGTADFLGLKVQEIEKGKGNTIKRGAKGTKSFTIYFKRRATVGGSSVVSLDFPVPGGVKVIDFYKWAKGFGKLAGIRTPDGVSYFWAKAAAQSGSGSGGGIDLPGPLGGLGLDDVGDLVDGIRDVIAGEGIIPNLLEAGRDILLD